jgi:ribonuclease Y
VRDRARRELSDFGDPLGGRNAGWVNPTERGASHVHIGIAVAAGVAVGAALVLLAVQVFGATSVGKARRIHRQLVDDAEREAEALRREAQIESREQAIKLRADIDAEHADRRMQVLKIEERVLAKEEDVERKLVELQRKDQGLADREVHLRQLQDELKQAKATQQAEIERVAGMSLQEAKAHLLERGEELVRHDLARRVRMLEEEARAESKRRARNLVADALQRVAASHAAETTVTVIELPSDDMKGRIIGREGRNIRALEHLTGVDFIIDDTPHAVVLSSFDGLRREVARLTLTKLIEDGRIHPARIEEMYYQSKAEIEDVVRQAGEQAVFEANCGPFHEELVRILGRLRFRTSYGQNVLKHTLEVVHLAGIMATELGASVQTAKRAAMLHDLGKAMTHEIEGSHAAISAQFARRYGESQGVVHAVEAHHYEVQPQTVEAVLLISADAISASRPGARGESLEHYIKRLESLEQLAAAKPGVDKVYALQAGREIRVIVRPTEVDDDLAALLSHEIAREIEDQLEYPGQVKVTVIRESRSIDVARNHTTGSNGDGERRALDAAIETAPAPLDPASLESASLDPAPLDARPIEDSPSQAA